MLLTQSNLQIPFSDVHTLQCRVWIISHSLQVHCLHHEKYWIYSWWVTFHVAWLCDVETQTGFDKWHVCNLDKVCGIRKDYTYVSFFCSGTGKTTVALYRLWDLWMSSHLNKQDETFGCAVFVTASDNLRSEMEKMFRKLQVGRQAPTWTQMISRFQIFVGLMGRVDTFMFLP